MSAGISKPTTIKASTILASVLLLAVIALVIKNYNREYTDITKSWLKEDCLHINGFAHKESDDGMLVEVRLDDIQDIKQQCYQ